LPAPACSVPDQPAARTDREKSHPSCPRPKTSPTSAPQHDENHIIAERRAKLAEWRQSGKAYPNDFARENTAGKINDLYDGEDARNSPPRRSRSRSPAASCSSA
jgi:hypothetical protein